MTEIEKIQEEIEKVKNKYLSNTLDLISDYSRENQTKADYKGRQIYELLQNADDCYSPECNDINVKIELRGQKLIIQNTGRAFDARGIASLMHPDASSKYSDTIGCKGLGFRAVLNWANGIIICTRDFCVEFSYKKAVEVLDFYKENSNKAYIEELERIDRIPVLSTAKIVKDTTNQYLDKGYSTAIILNCGEKYIDTIQQQLLELQFEELLFLKHIRNIEIHSKDKIRTIEAVKEDGIFLIQEETQITEWKVWEKHGTIQQSNGKSKKYELLLAYNTDPSIRKKIRKEGVLYSFFKTEIPMPFPFLIHGTFELTSERNNLIKDNENNSQLIEFLIDFIIEKGIEIASLNNKCDYEALEFLIPSNDLYFLDKEYDFSNKLKDKIKNYKIFPSINGNYISLNDNPKYTDNGWHDVLNKSTFSNLIKICYDEKIKNYINENNVGFYSNGELVELINNDADEYVLNSLVAQIIELFHDEFNYPKIAPNILIDYDGKRIIDDTYKVFINPSNLFSLPNWCNLRFINKILENELRTFWNNCTIRTLIGNLSSFGCVEYSFDRVVNELTSQSNDEIDKVKSIIGWLFNYWKEHGQKFDSSLANVDIKVITRDGSINSANKCYFGSEYGNDIGERIIIYTTSPIYISSLKNIGLENESRDLIKPFLHTLGVREFPCIESVELSNDDKIKYIEYNSKHFPTLYTDRNETYSHSDFFSKYSPAINIDTIIDIVNILNKSNFEDLLFWILTDKNLYEHVTSENEISDLSFMKGFPPKKIDARYVKKEQMKSWLHKYFLEYPWISTISGEKVNTYNCTVYNHKLSPIVEVLDINYENLNSLLKRNSKKEVEVLLDKIGVAEDIVNLSKEKIYEILMRLPEVDKDCSLGKKIYTQLNLFYKEDKVNKLLTDNKTYEEFKKNGQVLAVNNKKLYYLPVSEVYYVGKKVYSDDILDHYPTLALNRRVGDSKVEKMFCVQSILKIGNISVADVAVHELNDEYQKNFRKLLPYIYAKRYEFDNKNKELHILKRSNICLVSNATTLYNIGPEEKRGKLKDYELIYSIEDKIAYIKVPSNIKTIDTLKNEMAFISSVAEVITTMIDVDGDKDSFTIILRSHSIKEVEDYFKGNGDETLSIVNLSKEKFSTTINHKEEFINGLSQASRKDLNDVKKLCDEVLGRSFDYIGINLEDSFDSLKQLFITLEIDIKDYNKYAYETLNVVDYHKNSWLDIKNSIRNKYLTYISKILLDANGTIENFERKKKEFDFIEINAINSFSFNLNDEISNNLKVSLAELNGQDDNYESFSSRLISGSENVLGNEPKTDKESAEKDETFDYKQSNEIIKNDTKNEFSIPELEAVKHQKSHNKGDGQKGGSYDPHTNKLKELYGFLAESKVYYTLLSRVGKDGSVEWFSGNAKKARINEKVNDSLGYDIKYSDRDGPHFVEVKGSKSNYIEFTLTKNEFDFAEKHKDNYELWFVKIGENNKPCEPFLLGNILLFNNGENFFNNSRFSVEQSEFKIRTKIKGKK